MLTSCSASANGQGLETHGVDELKDCGVGADAERQRQHRTAVKPRFFSSIRKPN
jgi:hypothetical protein